MEGYVLLCDIPTSAGDFEVMWGMFWYIIILTSAGDFEVCAGYPHVCRQQTVVVQHGSFRGQ